MRRATVGALIFLAAILAAPWCFAKDVLVIGITQFPSNFHPLIDAMLAKSYVLGLARRPFTVYDADWQLVCMLCTELPTLKNRLAVPEAAPNGQPGIAVTFTIRPEAVWGDGVPITTRDVLFTWTVGRHPKSGVTPTEFYRSLHRVEVRDDKTFTLHFDKRTFDYNAINDFQPLPAHIEEAAFAEPDAYRTRSRFETDTTNKGLYAGPYFITEVTPGSHVVLSRNPLWWGKRPAFDRVVVRVIENTAALEANLVSGAIDTIAGELGLPIDQALAFERRQGDRYRVLYKPGLVYEHIDLNLDHPILKDKRVRQALIQGIDRDAISRELFAGRQPVAHGPVSPLDWVYAEDVPRYSFDPVTAARLLDEAGWNATRGGVRQNNGGERLALEIMTTAGDRTREMVQQALQSQWKRLGVDVRIRNQPARVFFGQTVSQRRFSAMAMFAWLSAPESVPRTTLRSDQIPSAENNFAGQNYTGFRNAEVDDLIDRIEIETDRDRRRWLWHRLQRVYAEELPAIPLFFHANAFVLPKGLTGIEPTGHQYPTTLWIESWRWE